LGLLLHREEHTAGQACARAHPDGCRGEPGLGAEVRDRRQLDADPTASNAWDAWDGARPGVKADAVRPFPELVDAGAEKSAGLEQDGRAQDACPELRPVRPARQDAVRELCKQGAGRSAERSCAEPVSEAEAEPRQRVEQWDAALGAAAAVAQTQLPEARRVSAAPQRALLVSQAPAELRQQLAEPQASRSGAQRAGLAQRALPE